MLKDQGKSKDFISDEMWHKWGLASWRLLMEVQVPLNLSCSPLFRMWYSFSKPVFGVPNLGRNTELQLKSFRNTPSISSAQGIAVIESTVELKSTWLKSSSNELHLACGYNVAGTWRRAGGGGMYISTPMVLVGSNHYDQQGEPSLTTIGYC